MGRRINAWLLLPAVLLALGVGALLGRAIQDDDTGQTASAPKAQVLGERLTAPEESTTTTELTTDSPAPVETTTTAAPATTATTAATATATTAKPPTTATTAKPATTTTTPARVAGCGTGAASAAGKFTITGDGPPSDPSFHYSGPVTVVNNTTAAIEVATLDVRITSADGTVETVAVPGAPGTVIQPGASKDFAFTYTTKHPPKEGGAQMGAFAYRPPGGPTNCASA